MGSLGLRLSRVFDRLREPLASNQQRRGEAILAIARVALAAGCMVAVYADFAPEAANRRLVLALAAVYLLLSGVFLSRVRMARHSKLSLQLSSHLTDLIWPTLLCLFNGGPSGAAIAMYLFAALGAAYRWGLVETVGTATGAVFLVWLTRGAAVWGAGAALRLPPPQNSTNTFVVHALCLLFFAGLLGYLAEREKSFRVQVLAVGQVLTKASSESGLQETVEHALRAIRMLTTASDLRLAVREERTGSAHLWSLSAKPDGAADSFQFSTLPASEQRPYFFNSPVNSWHTSGARTGPGGSYRCLIIDADGELLPHQDLPLEGAFFSSRPIRSVMTINFAISEEWSGRLFVLDSGTVISPQAELGFLQSLAWAALPSIHSAYLLRRLRTRIRTRERKRIAGELHDGLLQSLIALEMELDVLRRRSAPAAPEVACDMERFGRLLHDEILDARAVMEQLKLDEMSPRSMITAMSEMVARFGRETGIRSFFECDAQGLELPSFMCREVASILQEALVNVRKHSGARNVRVRFGLEAGEWRLTVADDGRGFAFAGRQCGAELERQERGPLLLRERARAIGAEVEIESEPGHGALVEVRLHPQETYV